MSLSVTPLNSIAQVAENPSTPSFPTQADADNSQPRPPLSEQIRQLEEQGDSATEIAANLGTTVTIVESYLDITATEEQATAGTTIQLTA